MNSKQKSLNSEIKKYFAYDPLSGVLHWRLDRGNVRAGDIAGYVDKDGHVQVGFQYKLYYAHRIIWFLMTGEWIPQIDHRDGDGSNNRWPNLRKATSSQNAANAKRHSDRISDLPKGVYRATHVKNKPFYSRIFVKGKDHRLGYFPTPDEASMAYQRAAKLHFREFAR